MQYLVIAYDNENALERRLESREAHIEGARKLMAEGKIINAGALIEDDVMVGSNFLLILNQMKRDWRMVRRMNLMLKIMFGIWMSSR